MPNISIYNELVVTNCTPVGLNRGYGGPQFYFALERVMDIPARGLGIDPAELRRRNFIPGDAFPYRAPAGAVFDAGDYDAALSGLLRIADYDELKRPPAEVRRTGGLFGIGLAAGVEPSGSNMAYVSLAQTAEDRPVPTANRAPTPVPWSRSIRADKSRCAYAALPMARVMPRLRRKSQPTHSDFIPRTLMW